jgi:hypothetical protein
MTYRLIAAFVVGYLFGSIPFGVLLTKFAGTKDIREVGSGNIGATNVLRTGRKGLAAATLIGDILKGTAAVLLVSALWGRNAALIAALHSATIAHAALGREFVGNCLCDEIAPTASPDTDDELVLRLGGHSDEQSKKRKPKANHIKSPWRR